MSTLHDAFVARNLLRALLRECTYLPDPASRTVIREQVLRRFRSYHYGDQFPTSLTKNAQCKPLQTRLPRKFREARSALSLLSRANTGDLPALYKVLLHTYGRIGKKRHELLKPLLRADFAVDADLQESIEDDPVNWLPAWEALLWPSKVGRPTPQNGGRQLRFGISKRYQKLRALVSSQMEIAPMDPPRARLRAGVFISPALNTWARPMPRKLERRRVVKWYGSVLERLLPPLPSDEWERLKELAYGVRKWDGPRKRRRAEETEPGRTSYRDLEMLIKHDEMGGGLEYLRMQCRQAGVSDKGTKKEMLTALTSTGISKYNYWDTWLANPTAVSQVFDKILDDSAGIITLPKRNLGVNLRTRDRQYITERLMRRLWAKVFSQCPKMDWNPAKSVWTVTWGSHGGLVPSVASVSRDNLLFGGVDLAGKVSTEESLEPKESYHSRGELKSFTTENWQHSYPLILEPWPPENKQNKQDPIVT